MFYNRLIYDIMSSDIISAHVGFGGTAKSRALKICRGEYTRKDLGRQDINAMNFEENLRYNNDYKRAKSFKICRKKAENESVIEVQYGTIYY